jgi:hypothetical protein
MATEVLTDGEVGTMVENSSDVPTLEVLGALQQQAGPEIAALARWGQMTQGYGASVSRAGNLFERDRYVTPDKVVDQMRIAYHAAEADDVVAGVLETTESLAFSKMSFYCDDLEEEDVWNQIAADLDLDSRLREMWRELFTVSQFYCAIWWGQKSYKVRGKSEKGVKRKKEFKNLRVPVGLSVLDPLKVVPVGLPMFNREKLAWIADRTEARTIDKTLEDPLSDPIMARLLLGPYVADKDEIARLNEAGFQVGTGTKLYLLNPDNVFRHTATRPQYQHFASVRMRSVFELLDLKHQLRQMDRAHLIGGTNFIIVITKGSDALPAQPAEITNLQMQVRTVAKLPVLVGDHRLNVEIVTPKLDNTLKPERYNTLDSRITARLYQMFVLGNYSAGTSGDKSGDLMRVVARGMESRRQMLKRTLEKHVFDQIFERNPGLESSPTLRFHPKQISLDFDSNLASFLLELRAANEISRETVLSQFDMDQDDEFRFRQREEEKYDDVFQTQVPFSAPAGGGAQAPGGVQNQLNKQAGRTGGGIRNGGGAAPGTGQGKPPLRPRKKSDNGRPKPAAAKEESE